MRDTRIKICPNHLCAKHITKVKHKRPSEKFCTFCGHELVYVCAQCLERIEDKGPEHRLCAACKAEAAERKEKVANVISTTAASITGKIPLMNKPKSN